jgi:hypothetical protein
VYVVLDDVGFSAMGCYGGTVDRVAITSAANPTSTWRVKPSG